MQSICGSDCCTACPQKAACGGCRETGGHPFGGSCVAAAHISREGPEAFADWKRATMAELNALNLPDLQLDDLHLLNGFYVNLEYRLPNGQAVKLLEDNKVYLGNQIERPGQERCSTSIMSATTIWTNGTLKTGASNTGPKRRSFCSMRRSMMKGGRQNEKFSNLPQMRRA